MIKLKIECREQDCKWQTRLLPSDDEEELFETAMTHQHFHKHDNMVWVETNVSPVALPMRMDK